MQPLELGDGKMHGELKILCLRGVLLWGRGVWEANLRSMATCNNTQFVRNNKYLWIISKVCIITMILIEFSILCFMELISYSVPAT